MKRTFLPAALIVFAACTFAFGQKDGKPLVETGFKWSVDNAAGCQTRWQSKQASASSMGDKKNADFGLGYCQLSANDLAGAEASFLKVVDRNPDAFFPNYLVGYSMYKSGKPSLALGFLEKAMTLADKAEDRDYGFLAHFWAGVAGNEAGKLLVSISAISSAKTKYKGIKGFDHELLILSSLAVNNYMASEVYDFAVMQADLFFQEYSAVAKNIPQDRKASLDDLRYGVYVQRAAARIMMDKSKHIEDAADDLASASEIPGMAPDALKLTDKFLTEVPNSAELVSVRGYILGNLNRHNEAITAHTMAIVLNGKYWKAHARRGFSYIQLQRYPAAIRDLTEAINLNPGWANSHNSRGWAYYQSKQYDRAIADFTKASELDPKNTQCLFNRALVWRAENRNDKALADYRRVLTIEPGNEFAKKEIAALGGTP